MVRSYFKAVKAEAALGVQVNPSLHNSYVRGVGNCTEIIDEFLVVACKAEESPHVARQAGFRPGRHYDTVHRDEGAKRALGLLDVEAVGMEDVED